MSVPPTVTAASANVTHLGPRRSDDDGSEPAPKRQRVEPVAFRDETLQKGGLWNALLHAFPDVFETNNTTRDPTMWTHKDIAAAVVAPKRGYEACLWSAMGQAAECCSDEVAGMMLKVFLCRIHDLFIARGGDCHELFSYLFTCHMHMRHLPKTISVFIAEYDTGHFGVTLDMSRIFQDRDLCKLTLIGNAPAFCSLVQRDLGLVVTPFLLVQCLNHSLSGDRSIAYGAQQHAIRFTPHDAMNVASRLLDWMPADGCEIRLREAEALYYFVDMETDMCYIKIHLRRHGQYADTECLSSLSSALSCIRERTSPSGPWCASWEERVHAVCDSYASALARVRRFHAGFHSELHTSTPLIPELCALVRAYV